MRKIEELVHLLDVAKMNYRQLGGVLDEDKRKLEEEKESARYLTSEKTIRYDNDGRDDSGDDDGYDDDNSYDDVEDDDSGDDDVDNDDSHDDDVEDDDSDDDYVDDGDSDRTAGGGEDDDDNNDSDCYNNDIKSLLLQCALNNFFEQLSNFVARASRVAENVT